MQRLSTFAVLLMIGVVPFALTGTSHAGVAYDDPAGGWTYVFLGEDAAQGDRDGYPTFNALDGTWGHENNYDKWDGSAIGAGSPGGVSALSEGNTRFVRFQDTGDPRDYNLGDPSNRNLSFGHSTTADLGAAASTLLDGVTLSFRARISTTGPLDERYPSGGVATEPWPAGGDGYVLQREGQNVFGIRQTSDEIISFALALQTDHPNLTNDGLTMNSLSGNQPSGNVDTGDGTLNLLPLDPTAWHEFWITIEPDTTFFGTHLVKIYKDGALVSDDFIVTSGNGQAFPDNYIGISFNYTGDSGAIDVDFMAYAPGIIAPQETPPTLTWDVAGHVDLTWEGADNWLPPGPPAAPLGRRCPGPTSIRSPSTRPPPWPST